MEFLPYSNNQILFQKINSTRHFSLAKPYRGLIPNFRNNKHKVVFVVGSTGTGKSKLAIDLATRFDGEIVNSDKIQVHDGLHVITNKVTEEECQGIPHHLIGGVHPEADFTATDFRREAVSAIDSIVTRGRLPIVAGGSNSYIEELVDGSEFRSKYESVFVWVHVDLHVLCACVSARVDRMVEMGSVEEARAVFDPEGGDYSRGIRRAIGVPEMDGYFRAEGYADVATRARLLETAIGDVKSNTCRLARRQLGKIMRLSALPGWDVRRVDATEAFMKKGEEEWERVARGPSVEIVRKFLCWDYSNDKINGTLNIGVSALAAAAEDANSSVTSNCCGSAAASTTGTAAAASATATVGSTH